MMNVYFPRGTTGSTGNRIDIFSHDDIWSAVSYRPRIKMRIVRTVVAQDASALRELSWAQLMARLTRHKLWASLQGPAPVLACTGERPAARSPTRGPRRFAYLRRPPSLHCRRAA